MTKDQWAKVDKALKTQFSIVKLKCDDYEVSLHLGQTRQFELAIMVHVNGWFKGSWFDTKSPSEEALRFFPTRYFYRYSAREKKLYKKLGKKYMQEHHIDLKERLAYQGMCWKSFSTLKRHLIKNNKSIELIEDQDADTQCTA